MRGCIKALSAIMFVFLVLFVAGCSDKEDEIEGDNVTQENLNEFFEAFAEEWNFLWSDDPNFLSEINNGYIIREDQFEDTDGEYFSETVKLDFHNYSDKGVLYFNGVYESILYSNVRWNYEEGRMEGGQELTINGNIKFHGKYKGTINFQNFKYKYDTNAENNATNYVDGSVNISTMDVTHKYFEEVILRSGSW